MNETEKKLKTLRLTIGASYFCGLANLCIMFFIALQPIPTFLKMLAFMLLAIVFATLAITIAIIGMKQSKETKVNTWQSDKHK